MIRNLFEYLVYALDPRRITDSRLKPWADQFLILRARMVETGQGVWRAKNSAILRGKKKIRVPLKACIRTCPIGV